MMRLAQVLIADVSIAQCTGLLVLEQVTGFVGVLVHFSAAAGALTNYEIILVVRGRYSETRARIGALRLFELRKSSSATACGQECESLSLPATKAVMPFERRF